MYENYVCPNLDYGSEVWSLQSKPETKWIIQWLYKIDLNSITVGLVSLHQPMATIWIWTGHQSKDKGK